MAGLELTPDSPTAQALAKAAASVTVTDALGRTITLKRPGVLAQYRLIEALGDTAKNEVYVGMALPLIYVSAIDGELTVQIARKSEVEALIQRLGEEGISAVMDAVRANFGAADPAKDRADLKN